MKKDQGNSPFNKIPRPRRNTAEFTSAPVASPGEGWRAAWMKFCAALKHQSQKNALTSSVAFKTQRGRRESAVTSGMDEHRGCARQDSLFLWIHIRTRMFTIRTSLGDQPEHMEADFPARSLSVAECLLQPCKKHCRPAIVYHCELGSLHIQG